jgi:hypothetical protein
MGIPAEWCKNSLNKQDTVTLRYLTYFGIFPKQQKIPLLLQLIQKRSGDVIIKTEGRSVPNHVGIG